MKKQNKIIISIIATIIVIGIVLVIGVYLSIQKPVCGNGIIERGDT